MKSFSLIAVVVLVVAVALVRSDNGQDRQVRGQGYFKQVLPKAIQKTETIAERILNTRTKRETVSPPVFAKNLKQGQETHRDTSNRGIMPWLSPKLLESLMKAKPEVVSRQALRKSLQVDENPVLNATI